MYLKNKSQGISNVWAYKTKQSIMCNYPKSSSVSLNYNKISKNHSTH
jgi:hypothetical protein